MIIEKGAWSQWIDLDDSAAEILTAARSETGMTVREAAAQIGISRQTLSNYEGGKQHRISMERLARIIAVYGIGEDDRAQLLRQADVANRKLAASGESISAGLTVEEYELVARYNALDDSGRDSIMTLLRQLTPAVELVR